MMAVKTTVALLAVLAVVLAAANAASPSGAPCDPCYPQIEDATVIEPVPGLRATVEIIANYGTCSVTYRGYRWYVNWGNGVSSFKDTSYLSPEQAQYTYDAPGVYNVTVGYCSHPDVCCDGCTYLSSIIKVTS
eukprot:m.102056 g.102056  ORF g.102056 m.102056 type:complete len:133 (+) comp15677_c2_seq3:30-428(+)